MLIYALLRPGIGRLGNAPSALIALFPYIEVQWLYASLPPLQQRVRVTQSQREARPIAEPSSLTPSPLPETRRLAAIHHSYKGTRTMSDKPVLHYLDGRGRMECIRWALAAAGVECEEKFFTTKEEFEKLVNSGDLLFQQVPMVEIDGMKLVQTRAILSYIAGKYGLYGKDLKERAFIDMYVEGTTDLMMLILTYNFIPENEKEPRKQLIKERALKRYYPVYEKALENQEFLVGKQLSIADVHLLESILAVEEIHGDLLQEFPNLQAFKSRISNIPNIKKFLEPGSKRKPIIDAHYIATVKSIFYS